MQGAKNRTVTDFPSQYGNFADDILFGHITQKTLAEMRGNRLHFRRNGSIISRQIGVVSAGIDNAEAVPGTGKIEIDFPDLRLGGIGKINGDNAADGAGNLIHQSAGLAEELILRILCEHCNLHRGNFSVIVEMVQDISDHVLKCGGRGKSASFEHAGSRVGIKAADFVSVFDKSGCHAGNDGIRVTEPCGVRRIVTHEVHHVFRKALRLDADGASPDGRNDGDNIKINGSGDHAAVVMVGVIARKLTAPRNRIQGDFTVRAVQLRKRSKCVGITCSFGKNRRVTVKMTELFIKRSVCDLIQEGFDVHSGSFPCGIRNR